MFAWFSLGFNAAQLAGAGVAMVSLPIVIHLINRMRFRRIRWAAMEFLLKAQKRQRRRLIIEQLILLAMRCLLIAMVAYWLGSFVGFGGDLLNLGKQGQTLHVVVLDDRPNMGDAWKDRGKSKTTAFDEAKKVLRETIGPRIVDAASHNGSNEYLIVYRLSDIDPAQFENPDQANVGDGDNVVFADRLNNNTLEELKGILGRDNMAKPSSVRLSPQVAMDKAVQVFEGKAPEIFQREGRPVFYKKDNMHTAQRQFYFLSGYREVDWKPAGVGDKATLRDKVDELVKKKVKMYGVDTLDPVRADRTIAPQYHENIALTSFSSEASVVPEFEPMSFTLVVNNFTNHRIEGVRLTVTENGVRNDIAPPFLNLKPGENTFAWKSPLHQIGFNNIQAQIEDPEGLRDQGLEADNTRFTVVKVEKLVHILCVDLDYPNFTRDKDGRGDSKKAPNTSGTFYLNAVLKSGYTLDSGRIEDLEKPTLFRYPCVFIMNAPELSKDAIENLDRFANEGGGVCFFLGDKVKPEEYNRNLFKDGNGIFPAPLDPRIRKLEGATEEEQKREREELENRLRAQEPGLFVRDEKHPMFAPVYEQDPERAVNTFLMFFILKQYFSVDPLRFKKVGKDADRVEELLTLPNRKLPAEYRDRAHRLILKVPAGDDPAWAQFQPTLNAHRREILARVEQGYGHLFELANDLYKFRQDAGNPKASRPSLQKFWEDARNDELRKEIDQFIEDIRFGDPFLVGKQVGKGRVLVCMSSANDTWNNWVTTPALYVPFMPALVKYLFRQADAASYECGTPLPDKMMHLDAKQYGKQLEIWKMPDAKDAKRPEGSVDNASGEKGSGSEKEEKRAEGPAENDPTYETKLGWTLIYQSPEKAAENGVYLYDYRKANDPGVYVVKRFPLAGDGAAAGVERKGLAFNIDATHEGDLRRTATEILEKKKAESEEGPGFYLVDKNAKFAELAKKQANFSESPWFYLALLLLLIAEQAMAVHCGHHTRATDVPAAAEISMHTGRATATAA